MTKEKVKKSFYLFLLYWLPVFCCLLVVYGFSSVKGDQSNGFSKWLVKEFALAFNLKSDWRSLQFYNLVLRKASHFSEYLILGLLLLRSIKNFVQNSALRLLYSCLAVVLFASTDEIYQGFVAGRQSLIYDVLIDVIGGLTGIILYYILKTRRKE